MWQRWNGTTKIFEKSSDNGVVWTPLGLDASIITQGNYVVNDPGGNALVLFKNAGVTKGYLGVQASGGLITGGAANSIFFRSEGVGFEWSADSGSTKHMTLSPSGALSLFSPDGNHVIAPTTPTNIATWQFVNAFSANNWIGTDNSSGSAFGSSAYGMTIYSSPPSGITLRANASNGTISFKINGNTIRHFMDANGGMYPASDATGVIGYTGSRYSLVRAVTITPGDLTFENGWTITEPEKIGINEPGLAFLDENENLVALIGPQGFKDIAALKYRKTTKQERGNKYWGLTKEQMGELENRNNNGK